MGSECLEYSFNAGPKSLNAPVYHHSSSLVGSAIYNNCFTIFCPFPRVLIFILFCKKLF